MILKLEAGRQHYGGNRGQRGQLLGVLGGKRQGFMLSWVFSCKSEPTQQSEASSKSVRCTHLPVRSCTCTHTLWRADSWDSAGYEQGWNHRLSSSAGKEVSKHPPLLAAFSIVYLSSNMLKVSMQTQNSRAGHIPPNSCKPLLIKH